MTRWLIILGALCVAVALCWWVWKGSPSPQTSTTSASTPVPAEPPDPTPMSTPVAATLPSSTPPTKSKEQLMSEALAVLNHQPIQFYGKVLDQDGAPVAGAKVTGGVMVQTKWMNGEIKNSYTTTDGAGLFAFNGLAGRDISIWLEKPGYEFKNGDHTLFKYSKLTKESERHTPDANAPVVFTMWKQKGPESLVHTKLSRLSVPVDGTAVEFDLITGQKTTGGGDLVVKLERNPVHIQRGQRFDWKVTLEVPNGGLIEIGDAYPNEAPAEGYEASTVVEMPVNSTEWQSSVTRGYYIKSRGGQSYARVNLRITADYEPPPTGVTLEAFVNPSGSRNLEYDSTKSADAQ